MYHLDNSLEDATTNSHDGTNYQSVNLAGSIISQGRTFDGTDDYVGIADGMHDFSGAFTVSAWAKWSDLADYQTLLGKDQDANNVAFVLFKNTGDNKIRIVTKLSGSQSASNFHGNAVNAGQWYHIAAVMDGSSNATIYVNAAGNTSAAMGNRNDLGSLRMGETPDPFWGSINGGLDEVRIETTPRSADWIKLSYMNQRAIDKLTQVEDYSGWTYNKQFIINTSASGANTSTDVGRFPMLIRLEDGVTMDMGQAQANGEDIRFANSSGKHLSYEIERWATGGSVDSAEIWVNVDTIYAGNASQYITMHWGEASAPDREDPKMVFSTDNGFKGVWHLNEDGNDNAGNYQDATANGNHGTGSSMTASSDVASAVGTGQYFDGGADYITAGDTVSLQLGTSHTVSIWINQEALPSDWVRYLGKGNTTYRNYGLWTATDGDLLYQIFSSGGNGSCDNDAGAGDPLNVAAGVTAHVAASYDGSNIRVYRDGKLEKPAPTARRPIPAMTP